MFGISFEHLIVLGVVLLFFGPRRLPELGNTMGKAIRNFKDALSGVEEATYRHIDNQADAKKEAPKVAPMTSQPQAEAPAGSSTATTSAT